MLSTPNFFKILLPVQVNQVLARISMRWLVRTALVSFVQKELKRKNETLWSLAEECGSALGAT